MIKSNSNIPKVKSLMNIIIYQIQKRHKKIKIERSQKIAKRFLRRNKYIYFKYWIFVFKWKINNLFILFIKCLWKVITFLTFPIRLIKNLWSLTDNSDFWNSFNDSHNRGFALDVVKTIISALGLIATIIAGFGLLLTYLDAQQDRQDARENRKLTEDRLVTDRFSKAVEQLGKIGEKQEPVRIGGIYSLERIAKDSPTDHWTVMEVLTAYIRNNSPLPKKSEKLNSQSRIGIDIQSALTVIKRREFKNDPDGQVLNLNNSYLKQANLEGANLREANLFRANLFRANLREANLREANLREANLFRVNLEGAYLFRANLEGANLEGANLFIANLEGAYLEGANLGGAYLGVADLEGAYLFRANLEGANLFRAYLFRANLEGANLSGANLSGANLSGADLSGADLSGADLSGADLSGADLSGADLSGADLSGAYLYRIKNLTNEEIKSACNWDKAIYSEAEFNRREFKWILIKEQANQEYIQKIRDDKASDPKGSPKCLQKKIRLN
jgi:uncharacterized protein YjbI with pentapeptide repeats